MKTPAELEAKAAALDAEAGELEDELEGNLDLEDQLAIAFQIDDLRRRAMRLRTAAQFKQIAAPG